MYKTERKKNVGALLFSFGKSKLRILKHVLEIEKTIMQNNLDKKFWKVVEVLKNNIFMVGISFYKKDRIWFEANLEDVSSEGSKLDL